MIVCNIGLVVYIYNIFEVDLLYLNENECIITSLNLYEFSQVNNNEMGVLIYRNEDTKLYADTYDEAQRIIRISDEVRMSLEKVTGPVNKVGSSTAETTSKPAEIDKPNYAKLTTAKLAKELGMKTQELNDKLVEVGYLEDKEGELVLTDAGSAAGGVSKRGKFGEFCLWDAGMVV